LREVSDF